MFCGSRKQAAFFWKRIIEINYKSCRSYLTKLNADLLPRDHTEEREQPQRNTRHSFRDTFSDKDGSPDKFFGKVGHISFYYASFPCGIWGGKCARISTRYHTFQDR